MKTNILPVHNVYTGHPLPLLLENCSFLIQRQEITLTGKNKTNENYFARVES
jgi:hypothetical protein